LNCYIHINANAKLYRQLQLCTLFYPSIMLIRGMCVFNGYAHSNTLYIGDADSVILCILSLDAYLA